ncbi:uncharacterized protein BP5553_03900 [Venustampulla echinocandica]|uniref:Uncharacterized protein n=1 Tax=Venustampulla echinocandica TaxID=2656787 RepID=A0A370TVK9_9HELO|nr:uncharacterized protein BP5553_03900 [Venustampulla echinocandica]RDL39560.1 hypothetical protein BP5553_03900 [Venustampulla echinocandica]
MPQPTRSQLRPLQAPTAPYYLRDLPGRKRHYAQPSARVSSPRLPLNIAPAPKPKNRLKLRLIIRHHPTANQVPRHVQAPSKQDTQTRAGLNCTSSNEDPLHGLESHHQHDELLDLDCSSPRVYSGPLGQDAHTIDPIEGRYCQSPEPISRERGGDLDPTQSIKAGELEDMEKDMKRK